MRESVATNHRIPPQSSGTLLKSSQARLSTKSALLIVDVSNLYYSIQNVFGPQARLDYRKYLHFLSDKVHNARAIAYGSDKDDVTLGFQSILSEIGYETKYKRPKIFIDKKTGREGRKADWDVGMALDVARFMDHADVIILGTADSDLTPCVHYIKEFSNKECWAYACKISLELRNAVDQWFEITEDHLLGRKHDHSNY